MEARSIVGYIQLGTVIRYLIDVRAGHGVHGDGYVLDNIEQLFDHLKENRLHVTERLAEEKLDQIVEELMATDSGAALTAAQSSALESAAWDLLAPLKAEAAGVRAFLVSDKRYPIESLTDDVSRLFASEVFAELPAVAQSDFGGAGRCIAFGLPTAAAFHVMRGTEDVLRSFYCSCVRRNRVDPLLWGPMVQALRKRRKPPPLELLDNLDNIRRSFRNPTQHPEKIYDIDEAQDLLSLAIDVVNRMVRLVREA